ncbi:MAG: DUF2062 domain-containing protein [Nitrospirota bacterium]|jgi:hypothetical protein
MALFERFRNVLAQILRIEDTPHRIALTFAVGVFLGLSPLIGLHTVLAIAVAWIFRLNRIVILSGAFINNPWSMIPIYTFSTWIGAEILGTDLLVTDVDWRGITLGTVVRDLEQLVVPFIFGTLLVAALFSVLCYVVVRKAAESSRENI